MNTKKDKLTPLEIEVAIREVLDGYKKETIHLDLAINKISQLAEFIVCNRKN